MMQILPHSAPVKPRKMISLDKKDDANIEDAVKKLIELNRDKLTEDQLVDLLASFYFVTNQCLSNSKKSASNWANSADSSTGKGTKVLDLEKNADRNQFLNLSNSNNIGSLREKKQRQWRKERDEMDKEESLFHPSKSNQSLSHGSLPGLRANQTPISFTEGQWQQQQSKFIRSAPSHTGLFFGDDPSAIAELKERQRRQWVAELDEQVRAKKSLRDLEKKQQLEDAKGLSVMDTPVYLQKSSLLIANSNNSAPNRFSQLQTKSQAMEPVPTFEQYPRDFNDENKFRTGMTEVFKDQNHAKGPEMKDMNELHSNEPDHARGRGLASLKEEHGEDVIRKRRQQKELQAAFDEQIKEREALRKLEKLRALREEEEELKRIEEERQKFLQETKEKQDHQREVQTALREARESVLLKAQIQAQQIKKDTQNRNKEIADPFRTSPSRQRRGNSEHKENLVNEAFSKGGKMYGDTVYAKQNKIVNVKSVSTETRDTARKLNSELSQENVKRRNRKHNEKKSSNKSSKVLSETQTRRQTFDAAPLPLGVVHTQSNLCRVPTNLPSAITDSEFAYYENSDMLQNPYEKQKTTVMDHVSQIKKSLLLRQKELERMRNANNCGHGHF